MEQDMVMLADQENTQGELFQIFHIKFGLKLVHTTTLGVVQSHFGVAYKISFRVRALTRWIRLFLFVWYDSISITDPCPFMSRWHTGVPSVRGSWWFLRNPRKFWSNQKSGFTGLLRILGDSWGFIEICRDPPGIMGIPRESFSKGCTNCGKCDIC